MFIDGSVYWSKVTNDVNTKKQMKHIVHIQYIKIMGGGQPNLTECQQGRGVDGI